MNYINQLLFQCKFFFFFWKIILSPIRFLGVSFHTPSAPFQPEGSSNKWPTLASRDFFRNYRPQRSCGQGDIFKLSVNHSVHRGGSASVHAGITRPGTSHTTPRTSHTSPRTRHPKTSHTPETSHSPQTRHPPGPGTPPSPGSWLQHTVYERAVRILLECILFSSTSSLVFSVITQSCQIWHFLYWSYISQLTLAKLSQLSRHENL